MLSLAEIYLKTSRTSMMTNIWHIVAAEGFRTTILCRLEKSTLNQISTAHKKFFTMLSYYHHVCDDDDE